jgi:hypothetical protein
MRALHRRRGQAAVELALGAIVFIGVLMAGIHLAEYAQLSLKVQDAQTFAIWDASLRRVQSRKDDGSTDVVPFQRTLSQSNGVASTAQRRFADFNGLEGTDQGNTIGRALTRGSGVEVRCVRDDQLLSFPGTAAVQGLMLDVGSLRCSSSARVSAINIPEKFLQRDEGGFFDEAIVRRRPLPVCGMGLPVEGACRGSLALLTNDWGLSDDETEQCKLFDCGRSPYRGLVQRMFGGGPGGGAGAAFASRFAGAAPVTPASYFFSYSGVESGMQQDLQGSEGATRFNTGGAGMGLVPRLQRPHCFLGKRCP